jgi:DNA processing protein
MTQNRFELRLGEADYPSLLSESPDPPARLFGIGDPSLLSPGLAVIGARKATPYGLHCTTIFAGWAASQGITVISGAAIGCDLTAHRAALAAGGPTVAVLGCGADVDYPTRAASVLRAMREEHCVVSECAWEQEPHRFAFPRRNRIIAGLAAAVLVVEAGMGSGTFSTADAALDAGREVFAVPGSIVSPESRGSNRLIRQGATPITDVSELAAALGAGLPQRHKMWVEPSPDPVLRAVLANPSRPDDLARNLNLDVVAVVRALTRLQAGGTVARYADGRYGPA